MKEKKEQYQVPQSFAEALMLAAKQQERIEQMQLALRSKEAEIIQLSAMITKMPQKVSYIDTILSSKGAVTTAQIIQDYGQSAEVSDALLEILGSAGSIMHAKWTQRERLFLYEELKKRNILPLIERGLM